MDTNDLVVIPHVLGRFPRHFAPSSTVNYFVLTVYVFSSCVAVIRSLYQYLQIARGETFLDKLLLLMHLAGDCIQNV